MQCSPVCRDAESQTELTGSVVDLTSAKQLAESLIADSNMNFFNTVKRSIGHDIDKQLEKTSSALPSSWGAGKTSPDRLANSGLVVDICTANSNENRVFHLRLTRCNVNVVVENCLSCFLLESGFWTNVVEPIVFSVSGATLVLEVYRGISSLALRRAGTGRVGACTDCRR